MQGLEGAIVVNKVREGKDDYNAASDTYGPAGDGRHRSGQGRADGPPERGERRELDADDGGLVAQKPKEEKGSGDADAGWRY